MQTSPIVQLNASGSLHAPRWQKTTCFSFGQPWPHLTSPWVTKSPDNTCVAQQSETTDHKPQVKKYVLLIQIDYLQHIWWPKKGKCNMFFKESESFSKSQLSLFQKRARVFSAFEKNQKKKSIFYFIGRHFLDSAFRLHLLFQVQARDLKIQATSWVASLRPPTVWPSLKPQ